MRMKVREGSIALVAFGGNAFTVDSDNYTIENQKSRS